MDVKKLKFKNGTTVFYTIELRPAEHTRFYKHLPLALRPFLRLFTLMPLANLHFLICSP